MAGDPFQKILSKKFFKLSPKVNLLKFHNILCFSELYEHYFFNILPCDGFNHYRNEISIYFRK